MYASAFKEKRSSSRINMIEDREDPQRSNLLDKNRCFPPLGDGERESEGDDLPSNRRELRAILKENRREKLISKLVNRLKNEVMETLIRVMREEIKQTLTDIVREIMGIGSISD